jgi:hypothetical protein
MHLEEVSERMSSEEGLRPVGGTADPKKHSRFLQTKLVRLFKTREELKDERESNCGDDNFR